jgi:hypothetical protein
LKSEGGIPVCKPLTSAEFSLREIETGTPPDDGLVLIERVVHGARDLEPALFILPLQKPVPRTCRLA